MTIGDRGFEVFHRRYSLGDPHPFRHGDDSGGGGGGPALIGFILVLALSAGLLLLWLIR